MIDEQLEQMIIQRNEFEARVKVLEGGGWISTEDRLPEETGRYWCYVNEIGALGSSNYQWNVCFNEYANMFHTEEGGKVTHWQELPPPPTKS